MMFSNRRVAWSESFTLTFVLYDIKIDLGLRLPMLMMMFNECIVMRFIHVVSMVFT